MVKDPLNHLAHLVAQSCPTLCAWMVARQAPLSLGFSRQEPWSGLPGPSPGDQPHPGIKPGPPALAGGFLTTEPRGRPSPFTTLGFPRAQRALCPPPHPRLQLVRKCQGQPVREGACEVQRPRQWRAGLWSLNEVPCGTQTRTRPQDALSSLCSAQKAFRAGPAVGQLPAMLPLLVKSPL